MRDKSRLMSSTRGRLGFFGVIGGLLFLWCTGLEEPAQLNTPLQAQVRQGAKPLNPEAVNRAIDRAMDYLRRNQREGAWEGGNAIGVLGLIEGGHTALATLALLEAGEDPNSRTIQQALQYLRKLPPRSTYVVSLQTMVLSRAEPHKDRLLIARNVDWLKKGFHPQRGWSYGPEGRLGGGDNSNSQYAVLGLYYAQAYGGVKIEPVFWRAVQAFYLSNQHPVTGGWGYSTGGVPGEERLTMTAAGVASLLIAGQMARQGWEKPRPDGSFENCGQRPEDPRLELGLRRLGQLFTYNVQPWRYYNFYGIERVGRLSGLRFFFKQNPFGVEQYDWYREGAKLLLQSQREDGSWSGGGGLDTDPIIATSFALLFLSKGKTPVLVHKLMHGPMVPGWGRSLVGDWNNDPYDMRNLTEFCSQHLFKKDGRPIPVTWQIFDGSRLDPGRPESVAALLQAPIAYFNGHNPPDFTPGEKRLLREFVEQGGFIFCEACCGSKKFDAAMPQLVRDIFGPEATLEPLGPGDPVWTAFFQVPPGSFGLMGVRKACRLHLIYAPQDISCYLEMNDLDDPKCHLAFRTAANIVAYATGLELPPPKEVTPEVLVEQQDPILRNVFQAAQIQYGSDWQPAPKAMTNLATYLLKEYRLDVVRQTRPISLGSPNLFAYRFLYMHGRRAFRSGDEANAEFPMPHLINLRRHLESGGLLLADACCGSQQFDKSFRDMMAKTFPDRKLEPIPLDDPLFSEQIGKRIDQLFCRTEAGKPYQLIQPRLEGIRLNPNDPRSRWIVIYSPYDLGCALEKHAGSDCIGYKHESALDLAAQIVLYALKE
ncbi:hypothetical protein HRbin36_02502 [bacterium HR36]|nr:hypothetical protein HRbin36_02502 [bacterium HR36]